MNQNEMLMYDMKYKKSVLAIMNIIAEKMKTLPVTKGRYCMGVDPISYYKTLEDTIIKEMKDNEDIQKDSRVYKLVEKYISVLLYRDIYFKPNGITNTISADMVYNVDNKESYSKITLDCSILAKIPTRNNRKFTDIEISPSIKISYNNITTIYDSNPIAKDDYCYNFNQIYINTINSLKHLIDDNHDMKNTISKIIDIKYLLQDMAMLITIFYMNSIISVDDYSKFLILKIDESKENKDCIFLHIDKNIDLIRSILYDIGKVDITLMNRILGKMNKIMKNAQNEAIDIMKKKNNE